MTKLLRFTSPVMHAPCWFDHLFKASILFECLQHIYVLMWVQLRFYSKLTL